MADYHFDIGFDWDSKQKEGFDGYLQVYPIAVNANVGSDSDFVHFRTGDTVEFYVYDVSEQKGGSPSIAADDSWLTFSAADDSTPASSPINVSLLSGCALQSAGDGSSTAFGTNLPAWNVLARGGRQLSVPVTQSGKFFFTMVLTVTKDGVTKRFGVDPEMIVET
jgi:hypothetical protein